MHTRTWFFYKVKPVEGGTKRIEFRRVAYGEVSDNLPEQLRKGMIVPAEADTDKAVKDFVLKTAWAGVEVRPVGDKLAEAVLQGRW